jgi:hypothetical protein
MPEDLFNILKGGLIPLDIKIDYQIPIISSYQELMFPKKYESLVQVRNVPDFRNYI